MSIYAREPRPPRPMPELAVANRLTAEDLRERENSEDPDEMRDPDSQTGRGAWLVLLLTGLAVVGTLLLLAWLAGAL